MDYSMPSSWMEGLDYFKYRSLGIFSLLGSTVYHDSAVNCGTVPSEEAFLLGAALLEAVPWDLHFWGAAPFANALPFGSTVPLRGLSLF